MRPQYVISMSGVNNEIHRLQGIENKANLKHTVEWYKILAPEAAFVCGTPVAESAFAVYFFQKYSASLLPLLWAVKSIEICFHSTLIQLL